jgi:hypothetical protein
VGSSMRRRPPSTETGDYWPVPGAHVAGAAKRAPEVVKSKREMPVPIGRGQETCCQELRHPERGASNHRGAVRSLQHSHRRRLSVCASHEGRCRREVRRRHQERMSRRKSLDIFKLERQTRRWDSLQRRTTLHRSLDMLDARAHRKSCGSPLNACRLRPSFNTLYF